VLREAIEPEKIFVSPQTPPCPAIAKPRGFAHSLGKSDDAPRRFTRGLAKGLVATGQGSLWEKRL
jgi:hypothetical protein